MLLAACAVVAFSAAPSSADQIYTPPQWSVCFVVKARFPRGVGKVGARDKTAGEPVTNFRRSNKLYGRAMHYNKRLDHDKDGIACEQ